MTGFSAHQCLACPVLKPVRVSVSCLLTKLCLPVKYTALKSQSRETCLDLEQRNKKPVR